jgi:hypothetical protein
MNLNTLEKNLNQQIKNEEVRKEYSVSFRKSGERKTEVSIKIPGARGGEPSYPQDPSTSYGKKDNKIKTLILTSTNKLFIHLSFTIQIY